MKKDNTSMTLQILIIFAVCVLGEVLHQIIPVPISSGVYGMVIMFLPISVQLIDMVSELKVLAIPVILAFSLVTFLVMLVSGKVTEFIIKIQNKKKENV